jgi:hypothetical protein
VLPFGGRKLFYYFALELRRDRLILAAYLALEPINDCILLKLEAVLSLFGCESVDYKLIDKDSLSHYLIITSSAISSNPPPTTTADLTA